MLYRKLGKTDLSVSEIGYGTWGLGGDSYGSVDDNMSIKALRLAFDQGCNFFDTSDLYGDGHSEDILSKSLNSMRKDILITTKFGMLPHTGFQMKQDFSNSHIQEALEKSLSRLRTDYVDLYLFHSPSRDQLKDSDRIFSFLRKMESEGKIRSLGLSARSPEDALFAINTLDINVIEINFNMIDQRAIELDLLKIAKERGVGIIARTPLSFGYLSGNLTGEEIFPKNDHRSNWPIAQRQTWAKAPGLFKKLNTGKPRSLVQLALLFCISYDEISTVIPGMLNDQEVMENMKVSLMDKLSSDELEMIRSIYENNNFYDPQSKK
jgi:aryl-alcohol dehydrogenase-like predicted oxidoreductase